LEINGQNNWLIFQAIIGYNGFLRSDASGPGDSISEKYPEKTELAYYISMSHNSCFVEKGREVDEV